MNQPGIVRKGLPVFLAASFLSSLLLITSPVSQGLADIRIQHNGLSPNSYYPNAIKVGDKIFVAYMGTQPGHDYSIYATTYDGSKWLPNTLVASNTGDWDAHGTPQMIRNESGYLMVFYGAHNTPINLAISDYPDNTSFWHFGMIYAAVSATYPTPVICPTNQSIYLFSRMDASDIAWTVSEDNGTSWSVAPHSILEQWSLNNYVAYVQYWVPVLKGTDYILPFAFDSYNYSTYRWGVFYSYFNFSNGHLYNINDTDLGLSIDSVGELATCALPGFGLNRSTGAPTPFIQADGKPGIIVTALEPGTALASNQWQEVFTQWNGTAWSTGQVIQDTAYYMTPATVFPKANGDVVAYLNNASVNTNYYEQVSKWRYSYSTGSWSKTATVLTMSDLSPGALFWYCGDGARVTGGEAQDMVYIGEYSATASGLTIYGVDHYGVSRFAVNGTNWASSPFIPNTVPPASSAGPIMALGIGIAVVAGILLTLGLSGYVREMLGHDEGGGPP